MTPEDYVNKFDIVACAPLYELWKYHEKSRAILAEDLTAFTVYGARGIMTGLDCRESSSHHIPSWLDQYIKSIGNAPNLFDLVEFNIAMARHISEGKDGCRCASIPGQAIRSFWTALTSVVDGSFEEVSVDVYKIAKGVEPLTGRVRSISCARTRGPSSPNQFELSVIWEETVTSTTSDLGGYLNHWLLRSPSPPKRLTIHHRRT